MSRSSSIKKYFIHSFSHGKAILDNLMYQIPGKDNYPADLQDHSFDMMMEDVRYNNHTMVNTGYYHRYFKTLDKGAMGIKVCRGREREGEGEREI